MGRSPGPHPLARPSVLRRKNSPQGGVSPPEVVAALGPPPGPGRPGRKAHIGEVQASVWDEQTLQACRDAGVILF